jgi:hypothetical protein
LLCEAKRQNHQGNGNAVIGCPKDEAVIAGGSCQVSKVFKVLPREFIEERRLEQRNYVPQIPRNTILAFPMLDVPNFVAHSSSAESFMFTRSQSP